MWAKKTGSDIQILGSHSAHGNQIEFKLPMPMHAVDLLAFAMSQQQAGRSIIIRRRGAEDVALIAADELESLQETAHLLRSPKKARRLFSALERGITTFRKARIPEKPPG